MTATSPYVMPGFHSSRVVTQIARLLGVTMALSSSTATAAKVDCATLQVLSIWDIRYKEPAQFPNPVRAIKKDLYSLTTPYRFADCGIVVEATAQRFSIQAKTTRGLLDVMGGLWLFPFLGTERQAGHLAFYKAATLSITLPDGLMRETVTVSGYVTGTYLPRDTVMAVRADGGKLQPLLYDGTFRPVEVSPKVKILELVVRSSKGVLWERMQLDVVHSKMTFFKKSAFPRQ